MSQIYSIGVTRFRQVVQNCGGSAKYCHHWLLVTLFSQQLRLVGYHYSSPKVASFVRACILALQLSTWQHKGWL